MEAVRIMKAFGAGSALAPHRMGTSETSGPLVCCRVGAQMERAQRLGRRSP